MKKKLNKPKRQQRTVGAFVKIQLDKKYHTYGRILNDAAFAIYDMRTGVDIQDLETIRSVPILFIVGIYNDAVTKGRWIKVGKMALEDNLQVNPPEFIQDQIDPTQFSIYYRGEMRPAIREECEGLECCAVWEPEHVESRIRDHYAGVPNKWVELVKIKDVET